MNSSLTDTAFPDTVGEIAARFPATVRVFEKYGLDFCCGGNRPLTDACRERGADPDLVLGDIRRAVAASPAAVDTDWQTAPINALVDHIVETHHAYLKRQLPRLAAMLEKVASKHTAHADVLQPLLGVFTDMREELDAHLMKEEMILFPAIRNPGAFHCGGLQNPIRVMLAEHDSAGGALAEMRRLTAGYVPPADACNTFNALYFELAELESDLHRHIHLENNILFPRVLAQ